MFRDLLVHVDGSKAGRQRVKFAADLATTMGAELHGVHITPPLDVPPRFKPSLIPQVEADLSLRLDLDAKGAAAAFREEADMHPSSVHWFETKGDVVEGICDRARYADLVIVGQYEWQSPPERHPLPVAHAVVLRCGRPVLVLPAMAQSITLGRVVVAWDASREAVRAVHDALPLLRLSQSVQMVEMIEHSDEISETDAHCLLGHLAHHGVKVGRSVLRLVTANDHTSLRGQIEQGHYDLLVMGGYSHPMWHEFIFGGTTETILLTSQIPVLVSH